MFVRNLRRVGDACHVRQALELVSQCVQSVTNVFDIQPQFSTGGGWYSHNSQAMAIEKAETPWLFTSGARGLTSCQIPLLGESDEPRAYTVNFYFADLKAGDAEPPLELRLQGKTVARDFVPVREAGGAGKALVKSFTGISVKRNLEVEISSSDTVLPSLAAIEVIRE